ncbi:hypothetical protein Poli38472_013244 [Pythium oligandrum]|uniref:nitric oxide dioxygenase n=1 Tax=Pythium oligandrum TaxID=41045 RepID=A0A8K1C2P8_PYTOL|nr:hypothetical protein Poli38472_013244 [Pythium oligandrum]|eukprot:TMW55353.1 hypothetical protein Poli38472_013244 [Pythium oligandrum]
MVAVASNSTVAEPPAAAPNVPVTAPAKRVWPRAMAPSTIQILKATAPVVKEHGTAITSTMYKTMFSRYPEVKNLFNMSHHRVKTEEGETTSQQTRTLANAVIGFAANADRLGNLTEAVARMVHKHVSLDIREEHYPIVGECILFAIKQVLQDAATSEIMAAWEEGYFFLADLLIDAENAKRAEIEKQAGGWTGFRELRVDRKVRESSEVTSFYLTSTDPSVPLVTFEPGQFLCLKFDSLRENTLLRNYSVSSAPNTSFYRISVKKEARENVPSGIVSCHLHDVIEESSTLMVAPPCGHFYLQPTTKPLVFLSGGVGITPLLSMLESLVETRAKSDGPSSRVVFVQYVRTRDALAFGEHLEKLAGEHEWLDSHTVVGSEGGAFALPQLEEWLPSRDCEFYFCGPSGFMASVNKALAHEWAVPATQRHYEYFGPTQDLEQ